MSHMSNDSLYQQFYLLYINSLKLQQHDNLQKKKGLFHHSSFLAGGATLAAGRLMAEDGVLKVLLWILSLFTFVGLRQNLCNALARAENYISTYGFIILVFVLCFSLNLTKQ